jgi:hypothetical protein
MQLAAACVGERVHGVLGPLTLAARCVLLDEPGTGELPDHHVQGAGAVLDAACVAVLAQRPTERVRMHRLLAEVRQHRKPE